MRRIAACSFIQRMVCVIAIMMGVTAAAGAHGMGSFVQEAPPAPPATKTIADLLKGVERRDSAVQDLTVSYRYDYAESDPVRENGTPRSHQTVTTKGQMYLIERRHWRNTAIDYPAVLRSYDGRFATRAPTVEGSWATISDKRTQVAETLSGVFYHMMMLYEPKPDSANPGRSDGSLLSLLRNPNARVRPNMEEVNGHMAHVVELKREGSDEMLLEVWIDPERGYLPIKQQYYRGGEPMMRFEMEEVVEVWNQSNIETWYMTKGTKWLAAIPGVAGMETDSNWVLEVDGWDTDEPQIVANTNPSDESFRIWQDLPEGTFLRHLESRMRLSEGEFQSMMGEADPATQADGSATADEVTTETLAGGSKANANGSQGDAQAAAQSDGAGTDPSGAADKEGRGNTSGGSRWWYLGGAAALLAIVGAVAMFRRASS